MLGERIFTLLSLKENDNSNFINITILRKSLVSLQLRKRHKYIFAFHVTLMCVVSQVTMIFAIVEYEASEKYQIFSFFTSNKNPSRLI